MTDIKWPAVAIAALVILLFGAAAGWWIESLRWTADVKTIQAANSADMTLIANTAQAATSDAMAKQKAAEASAAAIDAKYTQDLANAQSEIKTLRAAVASGNFELHLNATCDNPASGDAVPGKSVTVSGTNATRPRLTDAAQRDYFTLRERISTANQQIAGLQSYITNVCLNSGGTTK